MNCTVLEPSLKKELIGISVLILWLAWLCFHVFANVWFLHGFKAFRRMWLLVSGIFKYNVVKNIPNILTVCLQTQPHFTVFCLSAGFKPPTFNELSDGEPFCASWVVEEFPAKPEAVKGNVFINSYTKL